MKLTRLVDYHLIFSLIMGVIALHGVQRSAAAIDVVDAPLNRMVDVATSTTAPRPGEFSRLKGTLDGKTYLAVVRFPVQPSGKYTLLNVFPAVEDSWRILVTGYYPLSTDTRREEGAAGSVSGQRGARFTDTGIDARRMNLSISPKSEGKFLYVAYFSSAPAEKFQIQLSTPQTPDKEVDGISAVNPYTKRQNVGWGSLLGEFWSVNLKDEPAPKGTTTGPNTTGTTTGTTPGGTTTGDPGTQPGVPSATMTVRAGSARVLSGGTVEIPVTMTGGRDVASMNVTIAYHDEVVTPTARPAQGSLFDALSVVLFESNNDRPATLRFGHATTENLSGSGLFATLKFRAIGQPGTRSALRVQVPAVHDSSGRPIEVRSIDGEIVIESDTPPPTRGGDPTGLPTVEDARSALQMSVRLIPEDLALDVDRDGVVTSNDAHILLVRAVGSQ
ncbi:MAG: cohesin domain-containing protein [Planctomycetaceae bacterium]